MKSIFKESWKQKLKSRGSDSLFSSICCSFSFLLILKPSTIKSLLGCTIFSFAQSLLLFYPLVPSIQIFVFLSRKYRSSVYFFLYIAKQLLAYYVFCKLLNNLLIFARFSQSIKAHYYCKYQIFSTEIFYTIIIDERRMLFYASETHRWKISHSHVHLICYYHIHQCGTNDTHEGVCNSAGVYVCIQVGCEGFADAALSL